MKKICLLLSITLALAGATAASLAYADVSSSAQRAGAYLVKQQRNSGAIGNLGLSAWAIQALAATGQDTSGTLNYLIKNINNLDSYSATDLERTILALLAGGIDPHKSNGNNLVALLEQKTEGGQIGSPELINDDIFGIIALLAAGEPITDNTVSASLQFLAKAQKSDGSFGWSALGGGDSNSTATAISAFELARRHGWIGSYNQEGATAYLKSAQNSDGGFSYLPTQESDSASTSWVTSAIIALRESPENWKNNGNNPYTYLQLLQTNNGGIRWRAGEQPDILTTSYAAIALAGKALPVAVLGQRDVTPSPSITPSPSTSPSIAPLPAISPSPTPTPTIIIAPTPVMTPIPTAAPTASSSPSSPSSPSTPAENITPAASPSPFISPTPSPTALPKGTLTPTPNVIILQQNTERPSTEIQEDDDAVIKIRYEESSNLIDKARKSLETFFSSSANPTPSPSFVINENPLPVTPKESPVPSVLSSRNDKNNSAKGLDGTLMTAAGIILICGATLRTVYQRRMTRTRQAQRF